MSTSAYDNESCYLYGFVEADADLPELPEGLKGGAPELLECDPVSAVVSPIEMDGKLRPRRRHLRAHQDVLSTIFEQVDVLPAAFGTVSNSPDAIRAMIEEHGPMFVDELAEVRGADEWRVTVVIDREDVFEYFVDQSAELREERDRIYAEGREPTRDEKIDLGQTFEQLLQERREQTVDRVRQHLEGAARRIDIEDPRNDETLAQLACLVEPESADAFEEAVHEAAEPFDDALVFELVGPDLPYSFVEIEVEFDAAA
jgi:hypothetical protein